MKFKATCRIASSLMAVSLSLTCFSGCKPDVDERLLEIPEKIEEILSYESKSEVTPVVHFYFNNSASTQGFFSKKLLANEAGGYERGTYDESDKINTVEFVNAVKTSFDGRYDTSEYYLGYAENSTAWEWKEASEDAQTGITSVFGSSSDPDFFLKHELNEKKLMQDVLKNFKPDDANTPTINMYLTSLSEIYQNMGDLTAWIREKTDVEEDYSASLLCMISDYNGKIYPIDGSAALEDQELTGTRPLYLIMTGPTDELYEYTTNLKNSLTSANFVENEDYSVYSFPEKKLTVLDKATDSIIVAQTLEEDENLSSSQTDKLLASGSFNANINLTSVKDTDYDELLTSEKLDLKEYIDLLAFRYEEHDFTDDRMILNLYVPLEDCTDSTKKLYDCYVYNKFEGTGSEEIDKLLQDNDFLDIYYYEPVDEEAEEEENEEQDVATATNIKLYDFEKMGFKFNTTVIDGGDVPAYVFGTPIDPEDAEDLEIANAASLAKDHKWLKINLEYKFDPSETETTGSIMLHIPVYAVIQSTIPSWVENCSFASKDYDETNADILSKTCNLLDFMNSLAGSDVNSEDLYKALYEDKIADIVVSIDDIPVVG